MPTATPFEYETQMASETEPSTRVETLGGHPRILVVRRRYLGDIVLLGSVLRNLRLHWPSAGITVLTEATYAGVVPLNPDANAVLTFPRRTNGWLEFARTLRRAQFTHVFDFDNTDKTALVARLTGAGVRATFDRELIPFRYHWVYTHTAKVTNAFYDSHHITETYLALPAAIGVPIASRDVTLALRPVDSAYAQRLVPRGGNKILIHPGSRSPHRIWPAERFADVTDRLQDNLGAQVFVTAGSGEHPLAEQIRSQARSHVVTLDSPHDVGKLAALLAQFDVFLCHDSGPMHIAAAVGTPVVALFGSQNATIWRPLGERHTLLQTPLPCACIGAAAPTPCVRDDSYRSYCVRKISADDVFAAVTRTLATGR
ncbi:MAG: glycosyltransferase family 9 protein [Opitutaceae bacterium]|nr:glycosyltransferase family 9 protein [Opitutaceae bacterium]